MKRWKQHHWYLLGGLCVLLILFFVPERVNVPVGTIVAFVLFFMAVVAWFDYRKRAWERKVRTPHNLTDALKTHLSPRGLRTAVWLTEHSVREMDLAMVISFGGVGIADGPDIGSVFELVQKGFYDGLIVVQDGVSQLGFTEKAWSLVDKKYPVPLFWRPGRSNEVDTQFGTAAG